MLLVVRSAARSVVFAILVVLSAVALGLTATIQSAFMLAATTALIVPGTATPNPSQQYMDNAVDYYLVPGGDCAGGCTTVPVPYIAQFWPIPLPGWGGLSGAKWNVSVQSGVTSLTTRYNNAVVEHPDDDITIFGYSQGATVASIVKGNLDNPVNADLLYFFLIANPQRPNGGVFERLAFLGTVPILDATFGNPTPTDTCEHSDGTVCATDFALQYDGVADFPTYPLNFLATLNAVAGFWYIHGTYLAPVDAEDEPSPYGYTPEEVEAAVAAAAETCDETTHCQRHGDTRYITLPARTLPIMQPLLDLGAATGTSAVVIPVVDLISPATQTLIETGYDRTDYGEPTPARLIPRVNPVKLATDLVNDIPEGVNAALNPGLDPLPGSVSTADATSSEVTVANSADPPADKPLIRLSAIAKPGQGLTLAATKPDRATNRGPIGTDVRPVKDLVNAIDGTVKKVDDTLKTAVKNVTDTATGTGTD